MATIGQHISNLRGLLVKYSKTYENYSDQFFYEFLNGARAEIIKQTSKAFNYLSEWAYQRYQIELEESDPPNWECVPDYLKSKCKVRKSKYRIPQPIKGRNRPLVSFQTLSGESITLYSELHQSIFKNDKVRNKFIMASIVNDYLYIWNRPDLKFVVADGIWENPIDWASIPSCDGSTESCYNVLTSDYPLDEDDKHGVYKKALELISVSLKVQQDITNDANEFIKS